MKKIPSQWALKHQVEILVWALFIFYETTVIGFISGHFGNLYAYVFHYGINIGIFYINALILLPWAHYNKSYFIPKLLTILIFLIVLYTFISYYTDKILIDLALIRSGNIEYNAQFVLRSVYRGIYFLCFSTGYYFIKRYIQERKITEILKREKLLYLISKHETEQELSKSQNAYLKAQINPHFLFNTLDFVYHSIQREPLHAAEAIILLSKMMRFAIDSDQQGQFIEMNDELIQVQNLIQLYQLRSSTQLNIHFEFAPETTALRIIPLVLLTLVENIFKHGDVKANENTLITVNIENEQLIIKTSNIINSRISTIKGYTGLQNLQKRLAFAYGKNQSFIFKTVEKRFETVLKIKLNATLQVKISDQS